MLVRIVKMSFKPEHVDTFLEIFDQSKAKIRQVNGCQFLELYQDKHLKNQFFTYSYWHSETDLDNYRHSDLFKTVWSKTKELFNDKPMAWSVDKIVSLD